MDMREKLGIWLTGSVVHALGGRYTGTIAKVIEQTVHNKWKGATTLEAVIVFEDGKQLVLNRGSQFELMERFGYETDRWVGARISVGSRSVERSDKKTGEVITTWQKFLLPVHVAPASVADDEMDADDEIIAPADDECDDLGVEAARFGRGRG